ncbi:MAG TPA: peptidylprolyl isomerase [Micromonosporaceae bacterium]|nr:peptidylprolyl isomerase [Micromonosporaceae bacterium]
MTNLKDRQRAAARARLEREMAARREQASRRRRRRNEILVGVAVLAVIGAVVGIVIGTSGGGKPSAAATLAPAKCTWTPNPALKGDAQNPANKTLVNTGSPPLTSVPHNGTREMTLDTSQGKIVITLDLTHAPCSAESMAFLTSKKFFDNTKCHRLTTAGIYVLQCGDPSGTGTGGPSYTYAHENLPTDQQPNYPAGVVAIANPGNQDLNGSQFFIVYQDTPESADESGALQSNLTSDYTIIGTVTSGLDIVQKVGKAGVTPTDASDPTDGAPKLPVDIKTATVGPIQP